MRLLLIMTLCAGILSVLLGGTAPMGRVLMAAGAPRLAALLMPDDAWRGSALYRAGDMQGAEKAWRDARAFYNLGNALALQGKFAEALEIYDIAVAAGDADARANFDTIAAEYARLELDVETLGLFATTKEEGDTLEAETGQGRGRASGTGDEVTNNNTMLGLVELDSAGRLGVRRVFDDRFVAADQRWLATLSDVPGSFLKARISHEHKRRVKLGLAPPEPEVLR